MPYADPAQQAAYQAKWISDRRLEWLAANGPCVDCGSTEDLQVDHVDPTTKVTHRIWSWSAERRAAELVKCVARCTPCHKIKNRGEKAKGEQNGNAVLTWPVVRAMRARFAEGDISKQAVAREFGVNRWTASEVLLGRTWREN